MSEVAGYKIPVHRSLCVPQLMAGVPRDIMVLNGALTAIFVFSLHLPWLVIANFVVHLAFVTACRNDPEFAQVLIKHLRQKERLEA